MKGFLQILVCLCVVVCRVMAQDTSGIHVGDKAPGIALPTVVDAVQSFGFPYKNKMVYVYFWSSSVPASKENLFRYAKIGKRYADLPYKGCDGFEMIAVAVQSDRNEWNNDIIKYNLSRINNCIALKGYKDFFVKAYKLTDLPAGFLVDESGSIVLKNPEVSVLQAYLEHKRNSPVNHDIHSGLDGKIVYGNDNIQNLPDQKLYLVNAKNDTLQTTMTDHAGNFHLESIDTATHMRIQILDPPTAQGKAVYIASGNGEIITAFKKNGSFYEYKVLGMDLPYLRSFQESAAPVKITQELSNLYVSENLFKNTATDISQEASKKLNLLVEKLNANPKTRLEIISHTDSKGDATANANLSYKRAQAIANYFMARGISKSRLKAIGRGEDEPLNRCIDGIDCTESEYEVNRRTEFRFYKTEQ